MKILKLERYKNLSLEKKRLIKLIITAVLVVGLSIAAFFLANSILSTQAVYRGVTVEGYDVGGMTASSLRSYLAGHYGTCLDNISLTFFSDDYQKSVSLSNLGISVDIEGMEKKALSVGRDGSFVSRLLEVFSLKKHPVTIPMDTKTDEKKLDTVIEDFNRNLRVDVIPPNVIISGDKVVLRTGASGWEVDRDGLKAKILEALKDLDDVFIHIPLKETLPPVIDIDTLYNAIARAPADAMFVKNADGTASVKPHINGRSIDRKQLADIVNRVESREASSQEEIELPVSITEPKVKTQDLESLLYRDVLATASTSFTTDTPNNKNRGINIGICAQALNGTVVFPGDEFSFNGVVGPRTADKGYVVAHIFSEGQIKDDYGGGICQVSTTLYDAALWANLNISERHNHIFAVGYVPLGLDAAISYGSYDLKFKNTTDYPIRIDAKVSGDNTLTFSIAGTNPYPNIKVKTITKTISTTKATIEYVDDPNLPAGTESVAEKGIDGAVVETYVQIYNGKDLIKNYKIHTSTYQMVPEKVKRGTKAG